MQLIKFYGQVYMYVCVSCKRMIVGMKTSECQKNQMPQKKINKFTSTRIKPLYAKRYLLETERKIKKEENSLNKIVDL